MANEKQVMEFNSFWNEANKDYIEHIERKAKNMLIRVALMYKIRNKWIQDLICTFPSFLCAACSMRAALVDHLQPDGLEKNGNAVGAEDDGDDNMDTEVADGGLAVKDEADNGNDMDEDNPLLPGETSAQDDTVPFVIPSATDLGVRVRRILNMSKYASIDSRLLEKKPSRSVYANDSERLEKQSCEKGFFQKQRHDFQLAAGSDPLEIDPTDPDVDAGDQDGDAAESTDVADTAKILEEFEERKTFNVPNDEFVWGKFEDKFWPRGVDCEAVRVTSKLCMSTLSKKAALRYRTTEALLAAQNAANAKSWDQMMNLNRGTDATSDAYYTDRRNAESANVSAFSHNGRWMQLHDQMRSHPNRIPSNHLNQKRQYKRIGHKKKKTKHNTDSDAGEILASLRYGAEDELQAFSSSKEHGIAGIKPKKQRNPRSDHALPMSSIIVWDDFELVEHLQLCRKICMDLIQTQVSQSAQPHQGCNYRNQHMYNHLDISIIPSHHNTAIRVIECTTIYKWTCKLFSCNDTGTAVYTTTLGTI
ncbi:hypothetical protein BSLG_005947 [Batrachochytrium salamandrivorans]|nr:hypothetical protein BSLG_005947 [Batrachochytrium salamandrivorans]